MLELKQQGAMYIIPELDLIGSYLAGLGPLPFDVKPAKLIPKSFWDRRDVGVIRSMSIHIDQFLSTLFAKIDQFFHGKPSKSREWYLDYESKEKSEVVREAFNGAKEMKIAQRDFEAFGERLTGGPLLTHLQSICPENTHIISHFFVSTYASGLSEVLGEEIGKAVQAKKAYISIPITDNGHIVHLLVCLDHENKKSHIEFFDSFGFPASNYSKGGKSIEQWQEQVVQLLSSTRIEANRFSVNSRIVQQDKHSCGVFVAEHFRLRTRDGVAANKVADSFSNIDIVQRRRAIARSIKLGANKLKTAFKSAHPLSEMQEGKRANEHEIVDDGFCDLAND